MSTVRYQVGVTFTIEEMYDIELDADEACYTAAEEQAVEEFKQDFSGVPFWAGEEPEATIYNEEECDD